jgi:hypothetical protein
MFALLHRLHQWLLVSLSSCLITGCMMSTQESDDEVTEFDEFVAQTRQDVKQADKDWWKNRGQANRNIDILTRAYKDNGKNVGIQCKPWVQKVVSEASRGVVAVPTTTDSATGWKWNSSKYVKSLGSDINSAMPGDIVQMNIKGKDGVPGPHTAIVSARILSTIWWIDSNYVGTNIVGVHDQTVAKFLSSVTIDGVQKYTVYRITGG